MNPTAQPDLALLVSAAVAALVWKLYQLRRAPWDRALWTVAFALLSLLLAIAAGVWQAAVDRLIGGTATAILLALPGPLFALLVLIFFYFADRGQQAAAVRSARWQLVPAAVVYTMQVAVIGSLPAGMRMGGFEFAPVCVPQIATYYVSENLYLFYAVGLASILATRFARRADRRTARGLWVAAAGLFLCSLVGLIRITSVIMRVEGVATTFYDQIAMRALAVGMILFFVGVTYPGAASRMAAVRRWNWHRKIHRQLTPLWGCLAQAFPDSEFLGYPDVDAKRPWSRVSRRSSRRIVECRDGLVLIGPHLRELGVPDGEGDCDRLAAALVEAVSQRSEGREVRGAALRVLPATGHSLDDDVDRLLALAQALARLGGPGQISTGSDLFW